MPTHVLGLLDFENGAMATIQTSFDVWAHELPYIEIYGSEGTISLPDPNGFSGPVRIRKAGSPDWIDLPLVKGYPTNSRGLGVADMATAIRSGREHRANSELAFHVLDIMHAIHEAAENDCSMKIESFCERPAPMPVDMDNYFLDE